MLAEKLGGSASAAERWSQAVGAGRNDYICLVTSGDDPAGVPPFDVLVDEMPAD